MILDESKALQFELQQNEGKHNDPPMYSASVDSLANGNLVSPTLQPYVSLARQKKPVSTFFIFSLILNHCVPMFKLTSRSLLARGAQAVPSRLFSVFPARSNVFDELKKTEAGKENPETKRNASTVFDIDELIANSPDLHEPLHQRNKYDGYSFGNTAKDPRDVAKGIRITGPNAGRSFEVKYNNFGKAMGGLHTIIRTNKIRLLKNTQKRHIPRAKLQKQKHRLWWKQQFRKGFQDLMAQVADAKRRGY